MAEQNNGAQKLSEPQMQALRSAFIELIEEKGLVSTTLDDVSAASGVDRGELGAAFKNKNQLLQAFEKEVLDDLKSFKTKLKAIKPTDAMRLVAFKKPLPIIVEMFDYLRTQGDFLHAVMGKRGHAMFTSRLRRFMTEGIVAPALEKVYSKHVGEVFLDYYTAYLGSAITGVVEQWVNTSMHETSEEMAAILMRLFFFKPGDSMKK